MDKAQRFVTKVLKMAKQDGLNVFVVTDGRSGYSNNGNPAVKNARDAHTKWELDNGFDPDEDWSKEVNKESVLINGSYSDLLN